MDAKLGILTETVSAAAGMQKERHKTFDNHTEPPYFRKLVEAAAVGPVTCCEEARVSVVGNSLYTSARYARTWWGRGGGGSQAEPGASAKGHLANGIFCVYKYQLATQLDSQ